MSPRPSRQQAEDFLKFANHLADAARGPTLQHFRERIDIDNKLDSGFDPVTVADRDAEAAIRALIESHHPEHGIIGEEHGVKESQSGLNWVLDPIDGTRAFISGSPLWGTLIALGDKEGPFLGILDQPYIGERYWGISLPDFKAAGIAGPRGNATLKTKDCAHISDAILSTTHPDLFESQSEKSAFSDLCDKVRMTRYGGDCYGYGLLALGFMDLVVEVGLQSYDIQAIIPIVEGAGGRVTNWQGQSAAQGGQIVAAGDPKIHEELLNFFSAY